MTEFALKLEGSRQASLIEWERTRVLAYTMAKPYLKNQKTSIEKFWPLDGDKNKASKKEDAKKRSAEILERAEKMNWSRSDKSKK